MKPERFNLNRKYKVDPQSLLVYTACHDLNSRGQRSEKCAETAALVAIDNVAAAQIVAQITEKPAETLFEGKGFCYIETGDRHAVRGDGSFFDLPNPIMKHAAPDMMQYDDKIRWVNDWMERNLG